MAKKNSRNSDSPVAWHLLSTHEALSALQSTLNGLSREEADLRLEKHGYNILPIYETPNLIQIIIHQFLSPLIYILFAAGILSLTIGDIKDAFFIFAVVAINAVIGAVQEWKAESSAAALQNLLKIHARVRRGGTELQITAEELVPGDIVLLESGQKVPADLRLLQSNNLSMDESLLTGESIAVEKNTPALSGTLSLSERSNMAFAGSTVMTGRGVGVVVATGINTEVGQIAHSVATGKATKAPLLLRMEQFARQISITVLVISAFISIIAIYRGAPALHVFFLATALIVSAIPEGLPVAVTVALSIATSRMFRRNVIVRKLTAVEGLGSCTYIASDKTGTLTLNQQTAKIITLPGGDTFEVSGEGYIGEGKVYSLSGNMPLESDIDRLKQLSRAAILCNEGHLSYEKNTAKWLHSGDTMDVALLALGYKLGLNPHEIRSQVKSLKEIPFESERRYAAYFYNDEDHGVKVAVKGAPEAILPFCNTMYTREGIKDIEPDSIEKESLELLKNGYRVLAVAHGKPISSDAFFREEGLRGLTFLGLVGFIDPLRPDAKNAVEKCHLAGITVGMITGDHPATAFHIAKELGIANTQGEVVTGNQLEEAGNPGSKEFAELVKSSQVFARVAPLQKLHIVEALIAAGHYVAVTGDGVNDAPALRRANIGVAMGSGTDVAKDAASIIITDDNFASIEAGVEEGRFAYDNIRKVIYLLISTGLAEIFLFVLAIIFTVPIPLTAVQLLWLNMVTNGIQDIALAFEAGEDGAMKRPPRNPEEGIFNKQMIEQTLIAGLTMVAAAFLAWYWLLSNGWEETAARNILLLLMVLLENFHTLNCRSEQISVFKIPLQRNIFLVAGILTAQGIHILAMHIPFMQQVLGVSPLPAATWLYLCGLASSLLIVVEIYKAFKLRVFS
ncbi:MAG: HAD-IC family P-type ATPase [Syntrophomonadaceae bacterium]|nr:HAD-IC family P-type ATPase [Syntrophomonadaceae bacterium]